MKADINMNLRSLIKNFQEGLVNESDEHLLPKDSLLRVNSAGELIDFLKTSITSTRPSIVSECSQLAYPYSHLHDPKLHGEVVLKILSGAPVIVISHQPTFFPYSGVYMQFVLADYLAKELRKTWGIDVAILYLCLDTDDACDRRIRTTHFPFPGTKDGSIPISYKVSDIYKNSPQFCVPFQSEDYRNIWKKSIVGRYNLLFSSIPEMKDELKSTQKNVENYLDYLLDETFALNPSSFSDFSLSILMRFLSDIVETPIIPIRFSDLFYLGRDSIFNLLGSWNEIVKIGMELLEKYDFKKDNMFSMGPAWIICKTCTFRNNASYEEILGALFDKKIKHECSRCGKYLEETDKDFTVMPKVILEDLSGIALTGANLTLTYAGSTQHVVLSNMIYQTLFDKKPPIYTWHPKHFLGSALEKASLNLILKSKNVESAKQALRLASEGRDSLLFSTQFSRMSDLSTNWAKHFQDKNLNDKMIYNENYDLFAQCQKVI